MEKISIIVPVYKVEKYLDRCVESIVNQTYKNLEIILVDDGSPDNCPQMCDKWAKKDSRIKVIHKQNGGVSSARNIGLDNATGEYIQFADSDDYLELNACELLINNMKETNADWVIANFNRIGSKFHQTEIIEKVMDNNFNTFKYMYEKRINGGIWNKLYLKSLIKFKFNENQKISEDFIFNCEYLQNCRKISFINDYIYNYISNDDSAIHSFSKTCYDDLCLVCDYIENNLKLKYKDNEKFFIKIQNIFFLGCFPNLIRTNIITLKEKKLLIKTYTKNKYFKIVKLNNLSFKQKILYVLLKLKMVRLLTFLYKIK